MISNQKIQSISGFHLTTHHLNTYERDVQVQTALCKTLRHPEDMHVDKLILGGTTTG
jgi:hypothetical protein